METISILTQIHDFHHAGIIGVLFDLVTITIFGFGVLFIVSKIGNIFKSKI